MLLRFSGLTATAVSFAALLSLSGGKNQRSAAAGLLTLGVFVWLIAVFSEPGGELMNRWQRYDRAVAGGSDGCRTDCFGVSSAVVVAAVPAHLRAAWLRRASRWPIGDAQAPSIYYGGMVWPLAWAFFYARLAWHLLRVAADTELTAIRSARGRAAVAGCDDLAAELSLRVDTIAGDAEFMRCGVQYPRSRSGCRLLICNWWIVRSARFVCECRCPFLRSFCSAGPC